MYAPIPDFYEDDLKSNLFIHDLFNTQKNQTPEVIAIHFQDVSLTYRELNEKSEILSRKISRQSGLSSIIGISTTRCIEMVIGVLAILKSGKAYLPLDPTYPTERLQQIIKDSGINCCLSVTKELALNLHQLIN